MVRLLTPAEAAARAAAREARGRPPPQLMVLIVLACLMAGFLVGTSSTLQLGRGKRGRRPHPWSTLVWRGPRPGLVKRLCEDSCAGFTRNGVCDEGRPTLPYRALWRRQQDPAQSVYQVYCDLGTDCGDCGTWYHTNSHESDAWRPIRDLRKLDANFSLQTRQSVTPQPFWMAYARAEKDWDVSSYIHQHTLYEHGHTWAWHNLLKDCIDASLDKRDPLSRRLVLDVGANFGYYSLLAASMGCRSIAWEPVPYFAAYFKYALLRNNMTNAVQLRETIAGSEGGNLTVLAALTREWGAAGVDGANLRPEVRVDGELRNVTRPVERLDASVQQDVLILKVDVEGHEASVMQSAKQLLLQHEVKHIFLDYSPGVAEKRGDWRAVQAHPTMLLGLLRAGFTVLHLPDDFRSAWPDWEGRKQLPDMKEVTQQSLLYDIADTQRMQNGSLGCPLPQDLQGRSPGMYECGSIPEGLDPRSFRSSFGHSANLWAFRMQPWFANIGMPAALVPPTYDVQHKYFVLGGEFGTGGRACLKLPPHEQVMNRCPCTAKDECGELERLVTELAAAGQLPPFPVQEGSLEAATGGSSISNW
ncbi:hypothetical protein ABPG77_007085 [Micractinium sp. CCAP 211/92]